MTNPKRPVDLASLLAEGEVQTCFEERGARRAKGSRAKATAGGGGWLGTEGLEGRAREAVRPVRGREVEFMAEEARRAARAGVRAPIVVRKPGDAGGAKGCRKVDA